MFQKWRQTCSSYSSSGRSGKYKQACPKSAILTTLVALIRMFSGLMSCESQLFRDHYHQFLFRLFPFFSLIGLFSDVTYSKGSQFGILYLGSELRLIACWNAYPAKITWAKSIIACWNLHCICNKLLLLKFFNSNLFFTNHNLLKWVFWLWTRLPSVTENELSYITLCIR